MIFLTFLIVAIIVFVISLRANRSKFRESDKETWAETSVFWKCLIVPAIIVLAGLFNPLKLERVDAGYVGIKVYLTGDKRGVSKYEYKTGWVIYNKWVATLHEFPSHQQHIDYDEQTVITKGGFPATIKPSFNYSLKTGEVGDMFQNLRLSVKEIEKQWLLTSIVGAVNDVSNKWAVDSIFNNREKFENEIVAEANKRTIKWFVISQLRTNIVPPKELADAIIRKTQAIQDVQVAENKKLVAIADQERMIAVAKGDSSKLVIDASAKAEAARREAEGEADAIKLRQQQITSQYIEWFKINKWNGALPQVQTGSSSGILLNLQKQ